MEQSPPPPGPRFSRLLGTRYATDRLIPIWIIPMIYAGAAFAGGLILPRLEHAYLLYASSASVGSASAVLSTVAAGMMALTAIVFSIAYITVQFSAIAYSPRLAMWFARDPLMFHALGMFIATFAYALATLAWLDREGSARVPLISVTLVIVLLLVSMALFVLMVRGLTNLTVTNTLHLIGDKGREVIRSTFARLDAQQDGGRAGPVLADLGPATQVLKYSGMPRSIAEVDTAALVRLAREAGGIIEFACAVGDTLVEDTLLLRIHGAARRVPDATVMRAIRLSPERTFEQDPKYPIRLLVDIAIKALSPAINDPTTAVQAIDQIEDLLRRLGARALDAGQVCDANGMLRLVLPMPSWDDYLRLSFDEIRLFGGSSVQVMRRLRAALAGIAESVADEGRTASVNEYLKHLDGGIERSMLDAADRAIASQADRQGLGVSRKQAPPREPPREPAREATRPQPAREPTDAA